MNLELVRREYTEHGIFGELLDEKGNLVAVTCERAYGNLDNEWHPKLPANTYECKRGKHRLASMTEFFETFEIENVPGHTDILFHSGNYQEDSEGCVLLGSQLGFRQGGGYMLMASKKSFEHFMKTQEGVDTFTLRVTDLES